MNAERNIGCIKEGLGYVVHLRIRNSWLSWKLMITNRNKERKGRAIAGPAPCLGYLYSPVYQIPTSAAPRQEHT